MAVNWLARYTLIADEDNPTPPVDASFAVGARGGLALMMRKFAEMALRRAGGARSTRQTRLLDCV